MASAALLAAWLAVTALGAEDTGAPEDRGEAAALLQLEPLEVLGDARLHHAASVTHIQPLSDGQRALTTARDGSVRLWNLEPGRELRRYHHEDDSDVWNVKLLPGEREFLSCGGDRHVIRWDLDTGDILARYKLSTTVLRLAVVPGGKQFVACDSGRHASLWDIASGKRVQVFKGHRESVYSAAVSPDGKRLVTGSEDGSVRAFDIASGDELWAIEKAEEDDEQRLPEAADIEDLFGERPPAAEKRAKAAGRRGPGHSADVYTVCFLPDGQRVVSCSADQSLAMWNAADGKRLWKQKVSGGAKVVDCSPDGKRLAVTCDDASVLVLNAGDGKRVRRIEVPGEAHWPVAWSPDSARLLSGGDHMIYRWDATTGKQLFPPADGDSVRGGITHLALSRDGKRLYAAGEGQRIHVWDMSQRKRIAAWDAPDYLGALHVSPDGRQLLLADSDQLLVCDADSGNILRRFNPDDNMSVMTVAGGGTILLAMGWNSRLTAHRVADGQRLYTLDGDDRNVDYKHIIAGSGNHFLAIGEHTIEVRKVNDGRLVTQFARNLVGSVECAALLAGDRGLLIFNDDRDAPRLSAYISHVDADAASLPREKIRRLASQLGDEDFATRERAMDTLIRGGEKVLPELAAADMSDSEVRWRVAKVRDGIREGLIPTRPLKTVELPQRVEAAAAHPSLPQWAMITGYDCQASIRIGRLHGDTTAFGEAACDGHSPACAVFSPDGTRLYTGNRNGTVSVYRVK